MKYSVCIFTGTRADYGLLKNLIVRLNNNPKIDLQLLISGSHLSDNFGNTKNEIVADGIKNIVEIPILSGDDSKLGMAKNTGNAIVKYTDYLADNTPNLLIVLGDRYETLAVVISAKMLGVPIAHISGGDVTEGAIDDQIRHSITKMSDIHFPGCEQSRKRIIQMGENPDMVFNVGEPGVENCLNTDFLSREELADSLGFKGLLSNYAVVTYHPVTTENNTEIAQVKNLISAMDSVPEMSYIITMANADAGGKSINNYWKSEAKSHPRWIAVDSLGSRRYLSAVKYAKAVIGNSSSGIIEAPSLHVPTVNIGDRQKGRQMADSVVSCPPVTDDILMAINAVLKPEFKEKCLNVASPFGDGKTSERIERHIVDFLQSENYSPKKPFFDIDFCV